MKNFLYFALFLSLILNLFLLSQYYSEPTKINTVKVLNHKEVERGFVSEDTSMFVFDFMSKINQCETFLWSVSENRKEIKYTIWFAKN